MRATPCIGICSTTYGDLVCRGCKRFAHEIVAWNTYSSMQRERVWRRLYELRDQATALFVTVADQGALTDAALASRIEIGSDATLLTLGYEVLRRRARDLSDVESIGLRALDNVVRAPVEVRDAIDREFHIRSIAHFEHSFHVPVDS